MPVQLALRSSTSPLPLHPPMEQKNLGAFECQEASDPVVPPWTESLPQDCGPQKFSGLAFPSHGRSGKGEVPTTLLPLHPPLLPALREGARRPDLRVIGAASAEDRRRQTLRHTSTAPSGSPLSDRIVPEGRRLRLEGPSTCLKSPANRQAQEGLPSTTPGREPKPLAFAAHTPQPPSLPRRHPKSTSLTQTSPSPGSPLPPAQGPGSAAPGGTSSPPHSPTAEVRDFIVSLATRPLVRLGRRAGGTTGQALLRGVGRGLQGKCLKPLLQRCPYPEAAGEGRKAGVGRARP